MKYAYDIKGQLLKSIDPYDRDISVNYYTTAGQMLRTDHIDRGTQKIAMDALGLPVITTDAKGVETRSIYDKLVLALSHLPRTPFGWLSKRLRVYSLVKTLRYGKPSN